MYIHTYRIVSSDNTSANYTSTTTTTTTIHN